MRLTVSLDRDAQRALRLMRQWPDRLDAYQAGVLDGVAKTLHQAVVDAAPQGVIPGYPEMLAVLALESMGPLDLAWIGPPTGKTKYKLRVSDVGRVALWVVPKMAGQEAVDQAAAILAAESPWTMASLPYEPSRRVASIVSRSVTQREVRLIEQRQRSEGTRVQRQLREAGATLRPKEKVLLDESVQRDLAFEILRHEFGVKVKARAHWRPALRRLREMLVREAARRAGWVADPADMRWRSSRVTQPVDKGMLGRAKKFTDRVAPR